MRRWYVLSVLVLIGAVQQLDRQLLSILFEPIKHEFSLSDTQLGFLSGVCYAIPYALAGIPLGLLIDRVNRRNLAALLLVIWSSLTSLSGLARSGFFLAATRIGLSAAEAANTPIAYTFISDLFTPKTRRATALGVYMVYNPLGTMLGFVLGGTIAGLYGWRMAFYVAGVPGIVLAIVFLLTVREPARAPTGAGGAPAISDAPSFKTSVQFIRSQRSLLLIYGSMVMSALVSSAALMWLASFYVRTFGLGLKQAGLTIGIGFGLVGGIGGPLGGLVADRVARKDIRLVPLVGAAAVTLMMLGLFGMVLTSSLNVSIACMSLSSVALFAQWGPGLSLGQNLVASRMRGLLGSMLTVATNLLAAGVGAQLVGILSDAYAPWAGKESLRYAILTSSAMGVVSVAAYLSSRRTLTADLARAAALD